MQELRCVVVDDDELAITLIKQYANKTEGIEVVKAFSDPIEAANYLQKETVDFAFLDVEMPQMTGLEMLEHFDLPQIVLMSAHKHYAADGFDYNVVDFVSKPVTYVRFLEALKKVRSKELAPELSVEESSIFFVKEGVRFTKVDLNDVRYVEAAGDYIKIHTNNKRYMILGTMKQMEQKLAGGSFARIHRSTIINMKFMDEYEESSVYIGDTHLTVSRFYKQSFTDKINLL